jgi:uncharacterized protein YndB with AHSA1/START domain
MKTDQLPDSPATRPGPSLAAGQVHLERTLHHPPTAVYEAWSRREAQQRWGHPGDGWWLEARRFAFQVGQSDVWHFGEQGEAGFINENHHLVIEPRRRIVYLSTLRTVDGGSPDFVGVVAVDIEASSGGGCLLRFHEQGIHFDGRDDPAGHRAGWSHMLDQLARYLDEQRQGGSNGPMPGETLP